MTEVANLNRAGPAVTTGLASEGGHWYNRQGEAVYDIERADGKGMRPVNLRDARKLNLLPGVSSIIRCAAAPGLERWKQNQVLLAALTLPKRPDEKEYDWLDRVWEDSKAQAVAAANKGKRVHAAIERHYLGSLPIDEDLWPTVRAVKDTLLDKYGAVQWAAEKNFAHHLGFGGKRDLMSETDHIYLDFKTKEFGLNKGKIDKELAWDENLIQLCGYAMSAPAEATLANVFVSVTVPGLVYIHTWSADDRVRGSRMFRGLLQYWQAKNNYHSGWMNE